MSQLDSEIGNSHRIRHIQGLLYEAGKTGETAAASTIVRQALADGLRPVDILVGIITPLLYLIGVEWESSRITVGDEHRFTCFCERVFEVVALEVETAGLPSSENGEALVFVMNARGNSHTLGIRILSLWLRSKGVTTRAFHPPPTPETLCHAAVEMRPRAFLISVALERQKAYVQKIVQMIETMPGIRPSLFVGGYAIKRRLIAPIAGALFIEDLTNLNDLISGLV